MAGLRVQVDARSERMNLKIRQAQVDKIPYMLVVGDKEQDSGTVSMRLRTGESPGPLLLQEFQDRAIGAAKARDTYAI
jgi:threonyl-tRNA synthetase